MSFRWWVLLFVVLAAAALAVLAALVLRLWRKARALLSEVGSLTASLERAETAMRPRTDATDDVDAAGAALRAASSP